MPGVSIVKHFWLPPTWAFDCHTGSYDAIFSSINRTPCTCPNISSESEVNRFRECKHIRTFVIEVKCFPTCIVDITEELKLILYYLAAETSDGEWSVSLVGSYSISAGDADNEATIAARGKSRNFAIFFYCPVALISRTPCATPSTIATRKK